ncbi:MAG: aspartate aminotransferase family protein [Pseudomonadota bacterium]
MDGSNSLAMRDVEYHLHSQTDLRAHERDGPQIMTEGDGVYVLDAGGTRYLEAMAGLWNTALGFSERRLADAADAQMRKLPYYHTFFHKTPDVCIDLAERLVTMAPVPMSKAFFTNSGSEANDSAVKLIWYLNHGRGRPEKRKIISRLRGFHGVTGIAVSVTGLPRMHVDFGLPLPGFLHVSCPHFYRDGRPGESEEAFATRLAEELDALIVAEGPETVAAFFAEPVMGAGGVVVPPAGYFEKIQAVLRKHDVLLVADEVICGFGRTGEMWGSTAFGMEPDVLTCSKALSSGYFPIAAVLVSEEIYAGVADTSARNGGFGHGFTGSGHPVGSAVALETIKIIEERDLVGHVREVGPRLQDGLRRLAGHALVGEARGVGLIGALELVADKETRRPFDPALKAGIMTQDLALEQGLIVRALGDSIAVTPPLVISAEEIDDLLGRLERTLDAAAARLGAG